MEGFRDVLNRCSLGELRFVGQWYTWERGRSPKTRIRERLDRFLVSFSWMQLFSEAYIEHTLRYSSDHSAVVLRCAASHRLPRRRAGFRFETGWLLDDSCEGVVREAWEKSSGGVIIDRLGEVARELQMWSKKGFRNLGRQIGKLEKRLHEAQSKTTTEESCKECATLEMELDSLHAKNEAYWYHRSRVAEVKDGDRNTSYFHHKASQRKKRNYIHGICDRDREWQTEIEKVEVEVAHYFDTIFTSSKPSNDSLQAVLQHVRVSVTQEYNDLLLRPYTKEDIFEALNQMHPCKAPGPDGMHAIFYQRFWHIIGDEVFDFVSNILHNFSCPGNLNCTNIALIPKVKSPKYVSEFRPISLCNVLYKIASKAIVLRLKQFLPAIVTENQSAFVPGRLISDNSLIALEIFHSMKKRNNSRKGLVAMKLDMSKACDRVEWGFLRKLLLTMGFDGRWVNLIMSCVSSVQYSFIITGRVCGSVCPSRGLRQGDPLSPFLFILVVDAFSQMIQQNVNARELHGAKVSRNGPEISHLLFADDSLLFTRATRQECGVIVDILNKYEAASGQKINYEKSEVSFSKGMSYEKKEELIDLLHMRQVDRHQKYLGIPTVCSRSRKVIFRELLDRMWKKLQGWKEKLLSRAGKEVLIKAVIQALPTYLMGVYKIPAAIIQEFHSAMTRFWWGGKGEERKMHWLSWEKMCKPKCMGGMGFKDLRVFNDALLGKQVWRLSHYKNSLLSRVMSAKYYPQGDIFQA